jgi:hypothetical protein
VLEHSQRDRDEEDDEFYDDQELAFVMHSTANKSEYWNKEAGKISKNDVANMNNTKIMNKTDQNMEKLVR